MYVSLIDESNNDCLLQTRHGDTPDRPDYRNITTFPSHISMIHSIVLSTALCIHVSSDFAV